MSVGLRSMLTCAALAACATGCQTRVEVEVGRTVAMSERSIELRVHRAPAGVGCPTETELGALTPEMDLGEIVGRQELVELPGGSWSRGADLGHVPDRVLVVAFGRADDCTLVSAGCAEFDPARAAPVVVTLYPRTAGPVQCVAPAICTERFCRAPVAP